MAGVVAAELTARFIRLCMGQTESMVARLARNEVALRKPGGIELISAGWPNGSTAPSTSTCSG